MTDVMQRVKGAFYFLPLVICVVAGQPFLGFIIGCLQALMCYELAKMLTPSRKGIIAYSGLFMATALSSHPVIFGTPLLALTSLLMLISFIVIFIKHRFFIVLFTVALLQCLSSLTLLVSAPQSVMILVSLALIITVCDVAAYFVGRKLGGPKLAPSISPGKTISGAIGGLVGAAIMALFVGDYIAIVHSNAIVAGLIIGALAQAGDLFESAFKRAVGVKDSSHIIPGHGGMLDRFDGYIFVIPLMVALLSVSPL